MLKGSPPKRTGPPSRRKKRRAATIVEEYLRRQGMTGAVLCMRLLLMSWFQWSFIIVGQKRWLETHIWHAKRMHMKNIWGYRLVSMQCFISAARPNLNIHVSLVGRLPEREISASYLQSFFSSLDPAWRVLYELCWIERFSWRDYKYACPYHRYVCGVCGKSKVIWQFF